MCCTPTCASRGTATTLPQEAKALEQAFEIFNEFFRQCSGDKFYISDVQAVYSKKAWLLQDFPCELQLCQGQSSQRLSEISKELLTEIAGEELLEGRVQSIFLPQSADKLGCIWRGLSVAGFKQLFMRYKQPWLVLHVSGHFPTHHCTHVRSCVRESLGLMQYTRMSSNCCRLLAATGG